MHHYSRDQIVRAVDEDSLMVNIFGLRNPSRAVAASSPSRYFLHASPRSNRESILKHGLTMHQPFTDGNWSSLVGTGFAPTDEMMAVPAGVTVFPLGDTPDVLDPFYLGGQYGLRPIPGHEDEPWDYWIIDAQDIPHVIDPLAYDADILTAPVPPERLQRVDFII